MTNSCMVDIETYGTGPNAAIKSIGAVQFDPETERVFEGDAFHQVVDLDRTRPQYRGEIDPQTVEWWLRQPAEPVRVLIDSPAVPLGEALAGFTAWVWARFGNGSAARPDTTVELWSNGPTFDEIILRSAYRRYDLTFPFHFRTSRCMRTALAICKAIGGPREEIKQAGTKHSAVDDAVTQARRVCAMYRHLKRPVRA